jgi:O-methyltransferase involved in polyketide biosynthesis
MPADPSLISVTAKLVAYYRQFSDIPFAKDVARLIGADDAVEQILREHQLDRAVLTFYAPMFEARDKSLTHLIRQYGASQVLELASGYSLRGLDLTRGGTIRYVEIDLPEVVATKRRLLDDIRQQHAIAPSPLHTVSVANALDYGQLRAAAAVFDPRKPLLILCEGLIGYLTREEVERLAMNAKTLLDECAGGWWLVPDFSFRAEIRDLPPERVRLREAVTGITLRQLDASAFEDRDTLHAFLNRVGFDVHVRSQVDDTPSFSSIAALGLSPASVERLRPLLRLWVMTPGSHTGSGGAAR